MAAGITIEEGSELSNLRLAGGLACQRCQYKKTDDIWSFSTANPNVLELVAVWGSIGIGDLIMPHPMILSRKDEFVHPRTIYNNPDLFKPDPGDLFIVLDVTTTLGSYVFKLLPASGGDLRLAWYHLLRRRVTDTLMYNP